MEAIENIRDEITENMKLTEILTVEKKPANRQSYIELENGKNLRKTSMKELYS